MNKDIYKSGLILLAVILVVLMGFFGYKIEKGKASKEDIMVVDVKENDTEQEQEDFENIDNDKSNEKSTVDIIVVDISGAVKNPGIYDLEKGMRVNDLVSAAGGFSDNADFDYIEKNINKARVLSDEEKLYIPKVGDDISVISQISANNSIDFKNNNKSSGKININTALKEELTSLKGIGESFAQRIIDYRSKNKFKSIEDIKNVKGIGDKTFENIKDNITVE